MLGCEIKARKRAEGFVGFRISILWILSHNLPSNPLQSGDGNLCTTSRTLEFITHDRNHTRSRADPSAIKLSNNSNIHTYPPKAAAEREKGEDEPQKTTETDDLPKPSSEFPFSFHNCLQIMTFHALVSAYVLSP